jgi:hypothetical protein
VGQLAENDSGLLCPGPHPTISFETELVAGLLVRPHPINVEGLVQISQDLDWIADSHTQPSAKSGGRCLQFDNRVVNELPMNRIGIWFRPQPWLNDVEGEYRSGTRRQTDRGMIVHAEITLEPDDL